MMSQRAAARTRLAQSTRLVPMRLKMRSMRVNNKTSHITANAHRPPIVRVP
jgi:hypothetical protein